MESNPYVWCPGFKTLLRYGPHAMKGNTGTGTAGHIQVGANYRHCSSLVNKKDQGPTHPYLGRGVTRYTHPTPPNPRGLAAQVFTA